MIYINIVTLKLFYYLKVPNSNQHNKLNNTEDKNIYHKIKLKRMIKNTSQQIAITANNGNLALTSILISKEKNQFNHEDPDIILHFNRASIIENESFEESRSPSSNTK